MRERVRTIGEITRVGTTSADIFFSASEVNPATVAREILVASGVRPQFGEHLSAEINLDAEDRSLIDPTSFQAIEQLSDTDTLSNLSE